MVFCCYPYVDKGKRYNLSTLTEGY